jgi:hypothetical protein
MTSAVLSILELRTIFSVKIAQSRPCAMQKAGWDATSLATALEAVKNGSKTIGQAAKQYEVPYTTLLDGLKSGNI